MGGAGPGQPSMARVNHSADSVGLLQDLGRQLLEPPVDLGFRRKIRTATITDGEAISA
jgi:hypothetical protein